MADHDGHTINLGREAVDTDASNNCDHPWGLYCPKCDPLSMAEVDRLRAENTRLRAIRDLAADALTELDAQPDLAHPDAVWYTGGALRAALEATDG